MEKGKMKKWRKLIIIILFIILAISVIIVGRKIVIIKGLQNKIDSFNDIDNYHATSYQYFEKNLTIYDTYKKAEKSLCITNSLSEKFDTRMIIHYVDEDVNHVYFHSNENKIAILDGNGGTSPIPIVSAFETNNLFSLIKMSIFASITNEDFNGKRCYKVNFNTDDRLTYYIEKETGLTLRVLDNSSLVKDFYYEFNTVEDDNLKEPNLSEYIIQ